MNGATSKIQYVASRFDGLRKTSSGYEALCPLHDDNRPSLSISEGEGGGVVIHCHASCPTRDVLECVGLQMSDLMPDAPSIIATYDYRDEDGDLLFQVVRFFPKDFRQRRPKKGGGWDWKLGEVGRVLYRLPELLAADPGEFVFVVEGEKDAERLADLDLVATTNAGGASSPWLPAYTDALEGRRVVLIPDNDDAGRQRVREIANELLGVAKSVRIRELKGLSPKGDVSDWIEKHGKHARGKLLGLVKKTERIRRRFDTSTHRQDESEVATPPPEFPTEVFPKQIQRCIESIAAAAPCPTDYVGAMMLGVLSGVIGRRWSIEVKSGWVEYPVLWVVVVAPSGARKTPVLKDVSEPLRTKQRQLLAKYLEAKDDYESLTKEERAQTPQPRLKQVLATDTTIEALKDVLLSNPNGVTFLGDELSGWVRSMSQYKGGRGDDRQHWLSIWSLVQIVCNRKGAEPIIINDPFVSVVGGIQPDALPDLVDDARDDGFTARLLFAYPDPLPPQDWDEKSANTIEYVGICESLDSMEAPDGPLKFSTEGKAVFIDWVNVHRREVPPENLRSTWAKCEGHVARIALVLHLVRRACNVTKSKDVDEYSAAGAVKLIEYFKGHSRRAFEHTADVKIVSRIDKALSFIRKRGGTVKARDVQRSKIGGIKAADDAAALLRELESLGLGAVSEEARGSVVFTLTEPTTKQQSDEVSK